MSAAVEFDERFDGPELDRTRWIAHHLPQWSSRARSAARYELRDSRLRLLIEADQPAWCPEYDGEVRVSSLQTGLFAGPLGSTIGQHRFNPAAVVREEQESRRLYTPHHARVEMRARALDDPSCMVALWMIGYEDEPERSGEICVCEIFGSDVSPERARIGMGTRRFGDPRLEGDFEQVELPIDAREFHVYAADWEPDRVVFSVDGDVVKTVAEAPDYPMQLMLGIYRFPERAAAPDVFPKVFEVDHVRGERRRAAR